MAQFDDRKKAFENKYAHDAEMQFKADARRNRLIGTWAAELLGKSGDAVAEYAKEVVKADFEEAGSDDVVRKLVADLDGKAGEEEVRAKLAEFEAIAKDQVMTEAGD